MFSSLIDAVGHDLAAMHDFQRLLEGPHMSVAVEDPAYTVAFVHQAESMVVDQWQDVLCVCKLLSTPVLQLLVDVV